MSSVIIPYYNSESTIEECVRSVLHLQYPEIEVILVDDGSIDKTWDANYNNPCWQNMRDDIAAENAEYTDGTKGSIAEAINSVKKNFSLYSQNSYHFAQSYDYLTVSRKVFDEISKILTAG